MADLRVYYKNNSNYIEANNFYKKVNNQWVEIGTSELSAYIQEALVFPEIISQTTFELVAPGTLTAETCQCLALYNRVSVQSGVQWSITDGSNYATINSSGLITIMSTADDSPITVSASYCGETATHSMYVTYNQGSSSETSVEIVVDEHGNEQTTTTTTTENEDGSSYVETTTVVTDESGNTIGSAESTTTNNSDGSYESTIVNYDGDGNPTDGTNQSGDTSGNINTQEVTYDESGNTVITGYSIDTSNNPDGAKNYNADGVNTEYYAFDVTQGFKVDFHFTIDFSNQPAGQDENHHNVLTAKRASPSPWYGFQLRQSSTNKYIQLGTQFSSGSNTNTQINPMSSTGNTGEYNLTIIYDPTASTNKFKCINANTEAVIYQNNGTFPDIPDLKYLKVTIGYAMDPNGDPFRYSNINVMNFNIEKLSHVEKPVVSCDGLQITLSCETVGATIYYKLNQIGVYSVYTGPINITGNTIIQTYAELNGETSSVVTESCEYDSGVDAPVILCDGENVTITASTSGSVIYYRLNRTGEFALYNSGFTITADTVVEAYAKLNDLVSATVSETCIYNPGQDYSREYLTFDIVSAGTIYWAAAGSGYNRAIQYSVNNGAWTTIIADSVDPPAITVAQGDKVRFRGTNSTYAGSNTNYDGFSGTTAYYNVEGNMMSLVYGDNFIGETALTGNYNFCSMFKQSNIVSAENLILPTMVLTPHCYRALFANSPTLEVAPALPATTLAEGCYRYMFQDSSITTAPDLLATTIANESYMGMFNNCLNLTYIKCLATNMYNVNSGTTAWVTYINTTGGTFVKDANTEWERGVNGIPTRWVIVDYGLKKPSISCDGLEIVLSCDTQGATVYYRLNETGTYSTYSTPISITADTVVEAYSQLSGETSQIVKETCVYDDGITEPTIYCDGEYITMSCDTGGASIYYRLGQSGTYTQYEYAIVITADTICQAYSEIDGRQSELVTANCIYDASLKAPIIECDGTGVTITCHSVGADIYYRLNQEGSYQSYSSVIEITADTMVQAYSELSGETSETVSKNCVYNPYHDYSLDYLTLKVITDGTIGWNSIGTGSAKTIQYSKNDGAWTTITANSATTISVLAGDSVRFKGTNTRYCEGNKNNYSSFGSTEAGVGGGTALFNVEGNIMSLVYSDNFVGQTTLTSTYNFCQLFKCSHCVSAENLVLPSTTLTTYCYRAMFSRCTELTKAPALPATTLAEGCYWYMFEQSSSFTDAPELPAQTLVKGCYGHMFEACTSVNYIKCMAVSGFTASTARTDWVKSVAASGTFVKDSSVPVSTWGSGNSGIPTNWLVYDDVPIIAPVISCDGYNNVTISSETINADIYYRLNKTGEYSAYTTPIVITADTIVEAFAELDGQESRVVPQTCEYISDDPYEASNRDLKKWTYNGDEITTPYSVNALDGHSASYAKGTFNFETSFSLREVQPTYLWFQHADQSATIYVDDVLAEKHWGGYTAFFVDISNYVHAGSNKIKVALKNNEGNNLAPASGDFNFNATLGNVKLYTSPYIPAMNYGYDGFHVQTTASTSSATIEVRTSVPTGATVVCTIDDGTYHFSESSSSTNNEMVFTTTITNPHLWDGTADPHLYNITLEIYHDGDLYHRYQRPYGIRFFEYVINGTVSGETYTGFLLNGHPYLLRGCCMHDDIEGKANALDDTDYATTFATIQELGCNFLRLAHYPHPKETYDWCDRLGIVVQTEGPCVNKMQSTMPTDYYDHMNIQYDDMVNQHYNHPCIVFWGLSNETTTDDKDFAKTKINGYIARIRALDPSRPIGYVMAQGPGSDPSAYYNNPDADWFGCNIYDGWYSSPNSNNPTSSLNTRVRNVITNKSKILCYSEYGCGGTQRCHSDDYMTTTTRGNNPRHDIEYMMWLHEGQIEAIKNFPQLAFTSQWQLFDIAVSNRNEGYTVCLDGVNASTDDSLRRLNNKGLVERDHVTKKDPFYLYKAWWNTTDKFVHICGKDYTKTTDRVIKCYTNDDNVGKLSLYVNNTFVEETTVTNNIASFTTYNFSSGDVVRVDGATATDTLTF